jgi:hypothetical protein
MGIWRRREDTIFDSLPADRQTNIEVVSSAYASMLGDKAYLSMPVTSGRRFYEILDLYGVKTVEELEKKRPGALRQEIILPNVGEAKTFAARLAPELDTSLIVPGVFETRRQRWTQDEYMVLWLRLITSSIKEIYLLDGWEYSNGGAMEFARGFLIHYRFIEGREDRMPIYDHKRQVVDIVDGAHKLADAIKDLARRGYPTDVLRKELGRIAGMAYFCYDSMTSQEEYVYHTDCIGFNWYSIFTAAQSVDAPIALTWD